MDVDESANLSNSLVSDHSFEIVNIEGNSRAVSPNTSLLTTPPPQITDIMSNPINKEHLIQLESFETTEVAAEPGEEQLLTDEQNDEPQANVNDSDSLLQPVVLSVQGNIEMHDETDEIAILNELAPAETETLSSDEEENLEEFHNIEDTMEPEKQHESNDDDAANKDQEMGATRQESESAEHESEFAEQESESAEQEGESAEQDGESAEEEEQQTNVEEVLSEQEDESAGGHENEIEDDVVSDECEQQDQPEEDGSSYNAEEEEEKKDKDAESAADGVDLNETVFFSPESNKSDAEAIEATDDTDSFKSTE
jgi:hypothetical protein